MRTCSEKRVCVATLLTLAVTTVVWSMPAPGPLLQGRVYDVETGQPLPHVQVVLLDENENVVGKSFTDSTGTYELDPSFDRGAVVYSSPGYESRSLEWPADLAEAGHCGCGVKKVYLRRLLLP